MARPPRPPKRAPKQAKPAKRKPRKARAPKRPVAPPVPKKRPAKRAPRPTPRAPGPSRAKQRALDRMADLAEAPMRVETVPATRFALWQLRATFYLPPGSTYDSVAEILDRWDADRSIRRDVGARSAARIQVAYDHGRGRSGEYTLAEIGTFDFALSRAIERVDVRDGDDDALVARYGNESGDQSRITRLYLWLGAEIQRVTEDDYT